MSVAEASIIRDGSIGGDSPLDGSSLEPVRTSNAFDVEAALARARTAQGVWSALSARERGKRLARLKKPFLQMSARLVEIMRREQGKSPTESYTSEILPSADLFGFWAKEGQRLLEPEARGLDPFKFPKKAGVLTLQPRGVIGVITPWNYPVSLSLRSIVPALMAGNAVLYKPSEYAPRVCGALCELFAGLGVPDVVSLVQGGGDVGERLVTSGVDFVSFIGSVETGRRVGMLCAERLMRCSLELGGKDAAIVLEDADLERASDGIVWGAFANAGQNCAAIERVFVVESVADAFVEKVLAKTATLRLGDAGGEVWDVGPLVMQKGLAKVERHVADAIDRGAKLLCGGKATGRGLHFQPTVLANVGADSSLMTDETFGPVMPIVRVKDAEDAIGRANASVYGLTSSIWTRNLERGRTLASRLRSGVVTLNNHSFTATLPHVPWHGRGHSGGGITNSRLAFYELVEPQYVLVDRAKPKELWWFPHNGRLLTIARSLVGLLGGGGRPIASLMGVLKNLPKRFAA